MVVAPIPSADNRASAVAVGRENADAVASAAGRTHSAAVDSHDAVVAVVAASDLAGDAIATTSLVWASVPGAAVVETGAVHLLLCYRSLSVPAVVYPVAFHSFRIVAVAAVAVHLG